MSARAKVETQRKRRLTGVLQSMTFVCEQQSDLASLQLVPQRPERLVRHDHDCDNTNEVSSRRDFESRKGESRKRSRTNLAELRSSPSQRPISSQQG